MVLGVLEVLSVEQTAFTDVVGEADIEARDRLSREIVDCETWFRGRCTARFTRFDKFRWPKLSIKM